MAIYADICLALELQLEPEKPTEEFIVGHIYREHTEHIWPIENQNISRKQKEKEYSNWWTNVELFYRLRSPATL